MGVRNYPDIPRVYLDQDGPMYDMEKAAKAYGIEIEHYKRMAGTYLNLPLSEGAVEAVRTILAMGFEVFVLTKSPDSNPYAASEKLLSIQRDFPVLHGRVIITPDKGAVGRPQDFLIDDHPEWANANNFPGQILHFKYDWASTLKKLQAFKDAHPW